MMMDDKRFNLRHGHIIDELTGKNYNTLKSLCGLLNQVSDKADKNAEMYYDLLMHKDYGDVKLKKSASLVCDQYEQILQLQKENNNKDEHIRDLEQLLKGVGENNTELKEENEVLKRKLECCEYEHFLKGLEEVRQKVELGDYSDFGNLTMSKEDCEGKIIRW